MKLFPSFYSSGSRSTDSNECGSLYSVYHLPLWSGSGRYEQARGRADDGFCEPKRQNLAETRFHAKYVMPSKKDCKINIKYIYF